MPAIGRAAGRALVALGLGCVVTGPAAAQRPSAVRVSADNDAFNFWLPPWERTDQEYTSGVRGSVDFDGRSFVLKRLLPRLPASCGASMPCARHSYSIGQAIFTGPALEPGAHDGTAAAGSDGTFRPNAGWLYLQASERDSVDAVATELSIAVGVVGPQALGETMQRFFHSLGAEFQRPVNWERQLPFEPGFIARYTRTAYAHPWVDNGTWRAVPHTSIGGAIGTILTEGVAGAGIHTKAIVPGYERLWYVPAIEVSVDARLRGVIRDEFLDGAFFKSSERVRRRTVVVEQGVSAALRWRQLSLAYQVNHSGRQYDGQPMEMSWGTLAAEWRLAR